MEYFEIEANEFDDLSWYTAGYLREESGKVYKYDTLDEIDVLLYDFTLEVGDTIDYLSNDTGEPAIVTNITTELIAGEMRKVLFFNSETFCYDDPSEKWIEGIGSNTSLLNPFWDSDIDAFSCINCIQSDGELYGINGGDGLCNQLSIDNSELLTISLYPNPMKEQTTLSIPDLGAVGRLEIYSLDGKKILKKEITSSQITISKSVQMTTGIYIIKVYAKNGTSFTKKLIVQ